MAWQIRLFLLVAMAAAEAFPISLHPHRNAVHRPRRIYTNDLFTIEPGTVEVDTGVNVGSNVFTTPTAVRFEPDFESRWLRQIEFSISSDALTSTRQSNGWVTQFADVQTVSVLRPFFQREGLSFAVQPQAAFSTGAGQSPQVGGVLLAGWARGPNSVVGQFTGMAPTSPAPGDPPHEFGYEVTYTRALGRSRFSLAADAEWDVPSGQPPAGFLSVELLCRLRSNLTLDAGWRGQNIGTGLYGNHLLVGITVDFGTIGRRR